MEEDREATGEQHQGVEGVAGMGGGQVRGEARGQEGTDSGGSLDTGGGASGRHAQQGGQEEEEQDGQETGYCPSKVRFY